LIARSSTWASPSARVNLLLQAGLPAGRLGRAGAVLQAAAAAGKELLLPLADARLADPVAPGALGLWHDRAMSTYVRLVLAPFAVCLVMSVVPFKASAAAKTVVGGDVVGLSATRTVLKPVRVTRAVTVPAASGAGLQASAVGALLVTVEVSGARQGGRVSVGTPGEAGVAVVEYGRGSSSSGSAVVKVGVGGKLTVKASGGAPRVTVKVGGWVPRTSGLVVPPSARGAAVSGGGSNRKVQLTGSSGAPVGSEAVLVALQVQGARKAGTVRLGSSSSMVGSFGRGGGDVLVLARPGADGSLAVGLSSGARKVTARVVAWSATGGQLTAAPAATAAGSVSATKRVALRGRFGVPATAVRAVVVSAVSKAGTTLQVVPLDAKGAGRVVSPGGRANVAVQGWIADPGGSSSSYVPRAGTVVLGAGDVVAASTGSLTLDRSSDVPKVGGHVFVRIAAEGASAAGRVTSVTKAGGRTVLGIEPVSLDKAFSDFDAHYDGPITIASGTGDPRSLRLDGRESGFSPRGLLGSVPLGTAGIFDCDLGVDVPRITSWSLSLEDGSTYFDLNLGSRSIDFQTKGRLVAKLGLSGGTAEVKCALSDDFKKKLPQIPPIQLGSTPFALKIGPAASITAKAPFGPSEITGTARFAAGFSYIDGRKNVLNAVGVGIDTKTPPGALTLKAGVEASIGPAVVFDGPIRIDPNVSLTAGGKITAGPPEQDSDGQLLGPRCIDITANGFVDLGAQVAIKFFDFLKVDASFSAPPYETPKLNLYKGPCWGYEGSVAYSLTGNNLIPGLTIAYDQGVTLSMIGGQPARFIGSPGGGYVVQPYRWSAYNRTKRFYRFNGGDCNGRLADQAQGSGAGTRLLPSDGTKARPSGGAPIYGQILVFRLGELEFEPVNYLSIWPAQGEINADGQPQRLPGVTYGFDCSGNRSEEPGTERVAYITGSNPSIPATEAVPPAISLTTVGPRDASDANGAEERVTYNLHRVEVPRP